MILFLIACTSEPGITTWFADGDGDGYGNPKITFESREHPPGTVRDDNDCDDADASVHPGADEHCDGVDEDCDGAKDQDAVDATVWYLDRDSDGYGDDAEAQFACEAPLASVAVGGDCDDQDPDFNPGAPEPDCTDPTDWNCDGQTEYADKDGDGWIACLECDDLDGSVNPDALERCDGVDDDCDGFVDEEGALDPSAWFWDGDGDGFGDAKRSPGPALLPLATCQTAPTATTTSRPPSLGPRRCPVMGSTTTVTTGTSGAG